MAKRESATPDVVSYTVKKIVVERVVITGAMFQCTLCGGYKPASEFGLRMMEDGVVRNQAQCKKCR